MLAFAGASQIWSLPIFAGLAAMLCAPYVALCYWIFGVTLPWVQAAEKTNVIEMPQASRRERRREAA